jgi:N4-gp56 family major capsid protein
MVDPSTGYNTTPVNSCYVGIVHPSISYTLKTLTGWVDVEKYASNAKLMPGEIGKLDEVRFIETTNAKVFTGGGTAGIDVYATLILGQNAYGMSRISGEAMKNIVKPLGSAGSADPLDQRATSGWKATFVAKILNDAFMTRIESAAV